jgi:transcriptional regulator with XRE-family HTH domain
MRRRPHPLVSALAAIRQRQGLTQRMVAERAYLTPSLVGNWESGWKVPQLQGLMAYADVLGYEVAIVPKRGLRAVADIEQREAS